jgi:polyhydroxyalkanoate synthesis regulator phasin
MEVSLKNLLLAGIGTAAYSYEKTSSLIEDLVKKGEITISQGKELNEELKRKINKDKNTEEAQPVLTIGSLKEILAGLNLATKQDINELSSRLNKLENK